MKLVDKRYFNDVEPFISANNPPVEVSESNDQPDFTMEKFLVYDEFLKILYVISKWHEALMICIKPEEV